MTPARVALPLAALVVWGAVAARLVCRIAHGATIPRALEANTREGHLQWSRREAWRCPDGQTMWWYWRPRRATVIAYPGSAFACVHGCRVAEPALLTRQRWQGREYVQFPTTLRLRGRGWAWEDVVLLPVSESVSRCE